MEYIYGQEEAWKPILDRMLPFLSKYYNYFTGCIEFKRDGDEVIATCTDGKYMIVYRTLLHADERWFRDGEKLIVPKKNIDGCSLRLDANVNVNFYGSDALEQYTPDTNKVLRVERQVLLNVLKMTKPMHKPDVGLWFTNTGCDLVIEHSAFIASADCVHADISANFSVTIPCVCSCDMQFTLAGDYVYKYVRNSKDKYVSFCIAGYAVDSWTPAIYIDYEEDSRWQFVLMPFADSVKVKSDPEQAAITDCGLYAYGNAWIEFQ